eukprot:gb/GECH01005115.1/.p1 GENE.gb/GECH01005115.1/~~gb/GECH01005115.1/.p1  ORF type:complete len:260 (+),score=65.90 gb/GECH01005115.1/:1-780(+)
MNSESNPSSNKEGGYQFEGDTHIWYFAFGSNVNPQVFKQRRKIQPLVEKPGKAKGWCLCFDLPALPFVEPGMGSITCVNEEDKENQDKYDIFRDESGCAVVHGMVYKVTQEDFKELKLSEGDSKYYNLSAVTIETYDGEIIENAFAFTTHPKFRRNTLLPSKRYLNLIRDGAKTSQLDQKWCQHLDSLSCYDPDQTLAMLMRNLVMPLMQYSPTIGLWVLHILQKLMWWIHDSFCPVHGPPPNTLENSQDNNEDNKKDQ